MPRKGPAPKRERKPDPVYNNRLVGQLISQTLREGRRNLAERTVYETFEVIKKKTGGDAVAVFKKAVDNVKPLLEVKPRRVGGATYQVPVEVSEKRGTTLALRWMVGFARQNSGKKMMERLADEFIEASKGTGVSVKKKEDLHKMAEANRAFAHYRW